MTNAYVVTGTLTSATTVQLDEPLPLSDGRVRLIVETAAPPEAPQQSLQEYFTDLRKRQAARGHVPRSAQEIQAQIREVREGWDD